MTNDNIEKGIAEFLGRRGWEKDMHAAFYCEARAMRDRGLGSKEWLEWAKNTLIAWKAWRSPRPGLTKSLLSDTLRASACEVQRDVRSILACTKGAEPTIETVPWPVLEPLFDRAVGLKPTKYPSLVFGSKLCHFILPAVSPAVDNVLTGVPVSYARHWQHCRELWLGCETREKLKTYLGDKIRKLSSCEPGDDYPWATKIVELCLIGSRAS